MSLVFQQSLTLSIRDMTSNNITKLHPSIPEHAELVFSWVRAKVYQWDQEMYDGTTARFERIRFMDGAFTIPVLENGNILLTLQEQPARKPFFSLPGWALDKEWENPIEWAKRELLEETGCTSDDWHHWMDFTWTVHTATYVYYYIARNCRSIQDVAPDGWEKIELIEVNFDQFLELASDIRFQHHWNLLPYMYEARLSQKKYNELYEIIYGKKKI